MDSAKPIRSSVFILRILFIAFSIAYPFVSANEHSIVVGQNTTLHLLPDGLVVENSPGLKPRPGVKVVCERVNIRGLSRLKDLKKFAHSIKVKVSQNSSNLWPPNAEVYFHRNGSLGVGMCPQGRWEKVSKGLWVQPMSPFNHKILDVRTTGQSLKTFEVSIEEEFFLYRIIFLVLGIILWSLASTLSKSLAFYYGSAMLLTGDEASSNWPKELACNIYVLISCWLGNISPAICARVAAFNTCRDLNQRRHLANFLLAFVVMAGAWLGFLVVRKLVLAEDGSVDISTSNFVAWSIRILAAVMILQILFPFKSLSSLDPLLATEALISGIMVSTLLRKVFRLKFFRHMFKKLFKLVKNLFSHSEIPDLSPLQDMYEDYVYKRPEDYKSSRHKSKHFSMVSSSSPGRGIPRTSPSQLSDTEIFPSTFHSTPERRKISKEEWRKFTRLCEKSSRKLASSPDFSKWVATNADRITVTPNKIFSDSSSQHRKWLSLF
ncbi:hypothetical protein Q3G72_024491 [Acer saccharum]|nr:hypothetical protein Q3G72_024491 [Acer saccharum]